MSKGAELVSVVVIGRNEGMRLERCLTSVSKMHCEGFKLEVIYVDSGSTDNSIDLASRLGATTIALTSVHPTAALGRNVGWRLAQGDFVLFLDGDTVLDPQFVAQSVADFTDDTAIVWGHRRELYPSKSVYQGVLDLDWMYATGKSAFCGGDALFRRDVLEKTQGFETNLVAGEEPELCRRILELGYVIEHVDRAMTRHDLGITRFGQYWRRATRAGHAYAEVSDRFAKSSNPFWIRESRSNYFRALMLVLTAVSAIIGTLVFASAWPFAVWSSIICLLVTRTAWKARWKTRKWNLLLLYGCHSHLQQIPICFGQLKYRFNRQWGRQSSLFEYKKKED